MNYEKEIGNLNKDATRLLEKYEEKSRRIDKAIEYLNDMDNSDYLHISICIKELLGILKGEDKE